MLSGINWWDVFMLLPWIAAKATVVLAIAAIVGHRVWRTSAATRHAVWAITLFCILVLPVVILVAPPWMIDSTDISPAVQTEHPIADSEFIGAVDAYRSSASIGTSVNSESPKQKTKSAREVRSHEGVEQRASGPVSSGAGMYASLPGWFKKILPIALLFVWVVGAAGVLGYWLIGISRIRSITRRAGSINGGEIRVMYDELVQRLRIRREPFLMRSDQITVPMTYAFLRPIVLLPLEMWGWTPQRRRAVLLHELAHVKRHDYLITAIGHMACALFWFHPLVWWAVARLRYEAELATDDFVIQVGGEAAADYAQELLQIVREINQPDGRWSGALPLVRRSQIEQRIRAILDQKSNHRPRASLAIAILLPLLGGMTFAMGRVQMPSEPRVDVSGAIAAMMQPDTLPDSFAEPIVIPKTRPRPQAKPSAGSTITDRSSPQNFATTTNESDPSPQRAIVLNTKLSWGSNNWAHEMHSDMATMKYLDDRVRFELYEPNRNHIWIKYFAQPVEWQKYPILVVTYRGESLWKTTRKYFMWVDFGRGPNRRGGFYPFQHADMISDGHVHQMVFDLRQAGANTNGDTVVGFTSGIGTDDEVPAALELLDIRFEAAADSSINDVTAERDRYAVKVVDAAGNPIDGATVSVDAEWRNWSSSAVTDASGLAELTAYANEDQRHQIRVEKAGYVWIEQSQVLANQALPHVVTMYASGKYGGRVVDTDGNPIARAGVVVSARPASNPSGTRLYTRAHAVTDDEGRWRLDALPVDVENLHIKVVHYEFLSDMFSQRVEGEDILPYREMTAQKTLDRGVYVSGRVVNEDGRPVVRATVHVGKTLAVGQYHAVYTDKNGRFELPPLPWGNAQLTITNGEHYQPLFHTVDVESGLSSLELVLRRGNPVNMLVVDPAGLPVNGAQLRMTSWEGKTSFRVWKYSNAEGKVVWRNAPQGSGKFMILHDDYLAQKDIAITSSTQEPQIIHMKPTAFVRGMVVDDRTGEPLKYFKVVGGHLTDKDKKGACWHRNTTIVGNSEGYEINIASLWAEFRLRVEAPGYRAVVSDIFTSEGGSADWQVRLKPADAPVAN